MQTSGPKIALHFPCLSVCLFVCPHSSLVEYYVTYCYATVSSTIEQLCKPRYASVVLCCIDIEKVVGNRDNHGVISFSCQLELHDETAEPAFPLTAFGYLSSYA